MRRRTSLLILVLGLVMPALGRAEELLLVANPSVSLPHPLAAADVAAIYLLRTTVWPDGSPIIPVNREITSDLRARFTAGVLRQDSASLIAYWNEMHFKGRQPPLVQESEQAVLAFIRRVPGAVGYVGGGAVPEDVKVLARLPLPAPGPGSGPGPGPGPAGGGGGP